MLIQDRVDNWVIANVHPLIAAEALKRCDGDKCRLEWVSSYAVIIHNKGWFPTL